MIEEPGGNLNFTIKMNAQQFLKKHNLFEKYLLANVSSHLATSTESIYMVSKSCYIFIYKV